MGASSSKAVDVCSRLVGSHPQEEDAQFSKVGSAALLEERTSSPSASISSEDQGQASPRSEDGMDLRRLNSSCFDLVSAKSSGVFAESVIPTLNIALVVEDASDVQVSVPCNLTDDEMAQLVRKSVQAPEGGCDLLLIDSESSSTVSPTVSSVREGGRYKAWFHDAKAIEREFDIATAELHARTVAAEALAMEKAEVLRALAALREECESNEQTFLEESAERARYISAE